MEQIPPEAVLGATVYHLGLPCATHPATVARSNGFYTLIVAILVGGLLVNSLRTDQWIWLLPAGLALLLLFGLLASTLVVRHTSMVICTQGLLRIAGRRAESIRWEEMREVWQNAQGFLTVERPDGARFVINATFRAWEQLAATVEQEVLRLRLPQLWEQYQHGTPVRFGPIQVDQHGIWHDHARLPWEDYGGMSQYEGLLLLQQQDEQPWMWIALAEVPNIFLLEALLERISPETLQESKADDEQKNQKREKNEPR